MEGNTENDEVRHTEEEEYEHEFNFINRPWDNRSNRNKFGIIALLLSIFMATFALVLNNLMMHYRSYTSPMLRAKINCHLVKVDDYPFVARIQLMSSQEVLCLGAVLSSTAILASEVCVKSGPARLRLGSFNNFYCKKGFPIEIVDVIYHDGIVSKKLVILSGYFQECVEEISIGLNLSLNSRAFIIGRPLWGSRSLSRQPVTVVGVRNCTGSSFKTVNEKSTICVKDLAHCPVRAGDLLIQNGKLFGLASTSKHSRDLNKLAYFADLNLIRNELKDLDIELRP